MADARVLSCLLVVAFGCGDDGVYRTATSDLGKHGPPPTVTVRFPDELGGESVRMRRELGSTAAPFEGRACTIALVGLGTSSDTSAPAHLKNPKSSDYRTDTYYNARFEVRCSDGPAPGTPGTLRGGRPRGLLPWLAAALALGFAAGLLWARSEAKESGGGMALLALVLLVVAVAGPIGFAVWYCDLVFKLTVALLLGGVALASVVTGYLWRSRRAIGIASLAGALVGVLPWCFAYGAWTFGGPAAALACGLGGWVIASVVAELITTRS